MTMLSRRQLSIGMLVGLLAAVAAGSLVVQKVIEHSEKGQLSRKQINEESREIAEQMFEVVEGYHNIKISEEEKKQLQSRFAETMVARLSKYYSITE